MVGRSKSTALATGLGSTVVDSGQSSAGFGAMSTNDAANSNLRMAGMFGLCIGGASTNAA